MIINNAIQFRHIPRTGGRFLYNLFLKNNQKCVDHNFDMSFNNVEIPHLNALQTNCFYLKMFDNFTVVRNPLDRFISCLATSNTVDKKLIKKMFENKTNFFTTVNKLRQQSITNNWFESQINFIEHNTKIWKFENGFGKEFFKFIDENFAIKLDMTKDYSAEKFKDRYIDRNIIQLNEEQKGYVKNYYFLDYKILNYGLFKCKHTCGVRTNKERISI